MKNYKGETLKEAPPSTPVEVLGFESLPQAGDTLEVVKNEREAKKIAEERIRKTKRTQRSPTLSWELIKEKLEGKEVKEIPVIIKGDTQGSVEALRSSLEKLSNEEIKIKCIHEGVGNVNRSDVLLAYTARGIIIGFNVGKENEVESLSRTYGVKINIYRLIYDAIQETEKFINSLKAPALEQVKIGEAEIRRIFQVPKWGKVAGCYVLSGKVRRGAECRIKRGDDVIFEGVLSSLKRFKDDVKEVSEGYECGIGFEGFTDFQEGDVVEVFEWREKPR